MEWCGRCHRRAIAAGPKGDGSGAVCGWPKGDGGGAVEGGTMAACGWKHTMDFLHFFFWFNGRN